MAPKKQKPRLYSSASLGMNVYARTGDWGEMFQTASTAEAAGGYRKKRLGALHFGWSLAAVRRNQGRRTPHAHGPSASAQGCCLSAAAQADSHISLRPLTRLFVSLLPALVPSVVSSGPLDLFLTHENLL